MNIELSNLIIIIGISFVGGSILTAGILMYQGLKYQKSRGK